MSEELKQALDAMQYIREHHILQTKHKAGVETAIAALQAALSQPTQPAQVVAADESPFAKAAAMKTAPCNQCSGTLRGSTNGYSVFLRCDQCGAVPMPSLIPPAPTALNGGKA